MLRDNDYKGKFFDGIEPVPKFEGVFLSITFGQISKVENHQKQNI
jgi:hypothetical protein